KRPWLRADQHPGHHRAEQGDAGGDVERELKRLGVAVDEVVQDVSDGRIESDVVQSLELGSVDEVLDRLTLSGCRVDPPSRQARIQQVEVVAELRGPEP